MHRYLVARVFYVDLLGNEWVQSSVEVQSKLHRVVGRGISGKENIIFLYLNISSIFPKPEYMINNK